MSVIQFDIESVRSSLDTSNGLVERVRERTIGFEKVVRKAENEITLFHEAGQCAIRELQTKIFEVRELIGMLNAKIDKAQKKKQEKRCLPSEPNVPSNVTPDRRQAILSAYHDEKRRAEMQNVKIIEQNQRIDAYVFKCERAQSELENIISQLYRLESSLRKEIDSAMFGAREFIEKSYDVINRNARISTTMVSFNYALNQTFQAAEEIYTTEPKNIKQHLYLSKCFSITNTHTHNLTPCSHQEETMGKRLNTCRRNEENINSNEEHLIRSREENAFLEEVKDVNRMKMPSSNLHKLGGKNFIAKMNALGYVISVQKDGTCIDRHGMIHWEKKDD